MCFVDCLRMENEWKFLELRGRQRVGFAMMERSQKRFRWPRKLFFHSKFNVNFPWSFLSHDNQNVRKLCWREREREEKDLERTKTRKTSQTKTDLKFNRKRCGSEIMRMRFWGWNWFWSYRRPGAMRSIVDNEFWESFSRILLKLQTLASSNYAQMRWWINWRRPKRDEMIIVSHNIEVTSAESLCWKYFARVWRPWNEFSHSNGTLLFR